MKKSILISLLIGMMGGMTLSGCRDNSYDNSYVYTPNDNLYKFCAFDSSSYWVYEDSATHQIDSVVAVQKLEKGTQVTNPDTREWGNGKVFTFWQYYEIINTDNNITTTEPMIPNVGFPKPDDSGSNLNADELYTVLPKAYKSEYASHLNWYYMNISVPSENKYHFDVDFPSGMFKYSEHFDNITINNQVYKDVKKIEYYFDYDCKHYVICFWANGIGMVRREYHSIDSSVYVKNLIRYNVINVSNQYR